MTTRFGVALWVVARTEHEHWAPPGGTARRLVMCVRHFPFSIGWATEVAATFRLYHRDKNSQKSNLNDVNKIAVLLRVKSSSSASLPSLFLFLFPSLLWLIKYASWLEGALSSPSPPTPLVDFNCIYTYVCVCVCVLYVKQIRLPPESFGYPTPQGEALANHEANSALPTTLTTLHVIWYFCRASRLQHPSPAYSSQGAEPLLLHVNICKALLVHHVTFLSRSPSLDTRSRSRNLSCFPFLLGSGGAGVHSKTSDNSFTWFSWVHLRFIWLHFCFLFFSVLSVCKAEIAHGQRGRGGKS